MRLEKRTCEIISNDSEGTTYRLKCSILESMKWKPYTIKTEPLCSYEKVPHTKYNRHEWKFSCYEDNMTGGYMTFNPGTPDAYNVYDDHLVFIIPKFFEKTLTEGFYEAGEYEKVCDALKHYVRCLDTDTDYCLQYCGGSGDREYSYLKTLCEIEDALVFREDVTYNGTEEAHEVMEALMPLGVRTIIEIKIPNGCKLNPMEE